MLLMSWRRRLRSALQVSVHFVASYGDDGGNGRGDGRAEHLPVLCTSQVPAISSLNTPSYSVLTVISSVCCHLTFPSSQGILGSFMGRIHS